MPRIPTLDDLGGRPIPRSNRSIVSVRNAGAVADAVGNLGGKAAEYGQGMLEKQDKLAYATAKTAILKADVQARTELQNDPDYETYEPRYIERMKAAREAAAKTLQNRADRSLFIVDTDMDLERGRGQVSELATTKRIGARRAAHGDGLDALMDAGRSAPDEATRIAIVKNARDMFDAGVSEGFLSAEEAAKGKREWASNYIGSQVTQALMREDYDAAKSIYEANVDKLDWRTALNLGSDLKGMGDKRQAADDAYGSAPGYVSADTEVKQPAVGTMLSAIMSNESGGRQFGKNGKPLTSSAGAIGIMQVMPTTGPEAAQLAGLPWDEQRFKNDPDYNKALGVAYFQKQLEDFGDPVKAAAAYNAGPGAVRNALKKGGNWLEFLPAETQDYVAKFQKKTGAMQSARTWDKESWYANIDQRAEAEGWSFERTERAKAFADKQIARDEQLFDREQSDANEDASEIVLGLGDQFTSTSQIPREVWSKMSAAARERYTNAAQARVEQKEAQAEDTTVTTLELMRVQRPEQFAKVNLGEYAHMMTGKELVRLREEQKKIQEGSDDVPLAGQVSETIGRYDTPDMWSSDKKEAAKQRVRIQRIMEADLMQVTQGKRKPTDQEKYQAFINATGTALVFNKTFFGIETGGKREVKRYEVEIDDIPPAIVKRIKDGLMAKFNKEPTDEQIAEEYAIYKGRFW